MKRRTLLQLVLLTALSIEGQAATFLPVPTAVEVGRRAPRGTGADIALAVAYEKGVARPGAPSIAMHGSQPTRASVTVPLPATFYFFLSGLVSFAIVLRQQRRQRYSGASSA